MENLPSAAAFLCAFLSFALPYTVHKINTALHTHGDPPWKKEPEAGVHGETKRRQEDGHGEKSN